MESGWNEGSLRSAFRCPISLSSVPFPRSCVVFSGTTEQNAILLLKSKSYVVPRDLLRGTRLAQTAQKGLRQRELVSELVSARRALRDGLVGLGQRGPARRESRRQKKAPTFVGAKVSSSVLVYWTATGAGATGFAALPRFVGFAALSVRATPSIAVRASRTQYSARLRISVA